MSVVEAGAQMVPALSDSLLTGTGVVAMWEEREMLVTAAPVPVGLALVNPGLVVLAGAGVYFSRRD